MTECWSQTGKQYEVRSREDSKERWENWYFYDV